MSKIKTSTNGMGFIGWLQLLLIGLKLSGIIDWSWWWVWSPFLLITLFTIALAAALIIKNKY